MTRGQQIITKTISGFFLGMVFFSCKNDPADIIALNSNVELPMQTVVEGEYDFTGNGRLKNKLFAKKMDHYGGKDAHLHVTGGFVLITYNAEGVKESELSAQEGLYYESKRTMKAIRNVHLSNVNGNELFTEELTWEQDSARVVTEKRIKIVRQGSIIHGEGLVANETFSKYEILRPTGELEIEKENKTE